MLASLSVKFRSEVSAADGKAAAEYIQKALKNPWPGVTIRLSVMDLGAGEMHTVADFPGETTEDLLQQYMEFRTLAAVESTSFTPLVETQQGLAAYLKAIG